VGLSSRLGPDSFATIHSAAMGLEVHEMISKPEFCKGIVNAMVSDIDETLVALLSVDRPNVADLQARWGSKTV